MYVALVVDGTFVPSDVKLAVSGSAVLADVKDGVSGRIVGVGFAEKQTCA